MKRLLILGGGLVIVVGAAVAGWVAGSQIKSPEQVAAEAEAPEPSLITVEVERLTLAADVVTRGDVRFDQPEAVTALGVALEGVDPVVTWIAQPGFEFTEGAVLFEVAGRPGFALGGDLPLFRDLSRGAEGEDVAQFQEALARLGFDPGDIDGVYGPQTETAAAAMYEAAGYEILGPTDAELEAVQAATDAVADARPFYDEARAAETAAAAAEAKVPPAQAGLTAATQALTNAAAALQGALDSGLPEDDPAVVALADQVAAAQEGRDAAVATLQQLQAQAAEARAIADGFDVEAARRALSRAQRDLAEIQSRVGDKVPMSEIVFFGLFPLRVDTVAVARGGLASGELMTVSGSRLAIDSSVSIADAELIDVGDRVVIDLASRGIETEGEVTFKATRPGTNNVSAERVYIEVVPDEVLADLADTNVRLTIPVQSSGGEVLAVPASAISATADGSSQVQVEEGDGTTRFVTVTPGLSSGGLVQVTAADGDLEEGDRVVVGLS